MSPVLDLLSRDENVAPAFRRVVASPARTGYPGPIERADARRFNDDVCSGYAPFAPTAEERAQWAKEDHEDALYDESKLDDYRERERAADEEAMRYWPGGDR